MNKDIRVCLEYINQQKQCHNAGMFKLPINQNTLGGLIEDVYTNRRPAGEGVDDRLFQWDPVNEEIKNEIIISASRYKSEFFRPNKQLAVKAARKRKREQGGDDDDDDNEPSLYKKWFMDMNRKAMFGGADSYVEQRSRDRFLVQAMQRPFGLIGSQKHGKHIVEIDIKALGAEGMGSHGGITSGNLLYKSPSDGFDRDGLAAMSPLFGLPQNPGLFRNGQNYLKGEWQLPDAYQGYSEYNNRIIFSRMVEIPNAVVNVLLPFRYSEKLTPIIVNTLTFHDGMLHKLPYETVPRLLTSSSKSETTHLARWGLGAQIEGTLLNTPEGKMIWAMQINQIGVAAHRTILAGAVMALRNPAPQASTVNQQYGIGMKVKEFEIRLAKEAAQIGILQKQYSYPFNELIRQCEEEFRTRNVETSAGQLYCLLPSGVARTVFENNRTYSAYFLTGRPMTEPLDGNDKTSVAHIPPDHIIEINPLKVGISTPNVPLLRSQMTFGEFDVMCSTPPTAGTPGFRTGDCNLFVRDEPRDDYSEAPYAKYFNYNMFFDSNGEHDIAYKSRLVNGHWAGASYDPTREGEAGRFLNAYGAAFFSPCFDYTRFITGNDTSTDADNVDPDAIAPRNQMPQAANNRDVNRPMSVGVPLQQRLAFWRNFIESRRKHRSDLPFLSENMNKRNFETFDLSRQDRSSTESAVHCWAAEVGTVGEFYEYFCGLRNKTRFEQRHGSSDMVPYTERKEDEKDAKFPNVNYRGTGHLLGLKENSNALVDGPQVFEKSQAVWSNLVLNILRLRAADMHEFFSCMPTIQTVTINNNVSNALMPTAGLLKLTGTTAAGRIAPFYDGRLMEDEQVKSCITAILEMKSRHEQVNLGHSVVQVAQPVPPPAPPAKKGKSSAVIESSSSSSVAALEALARNPNGQLPNDHVLGATDIVGTGVLGEAQEIIRILLRAWPILSNDFFRQCQDFHIPIGMDILMLRPFITFEGDDAIIVANEGVGTTHLGHSNAMLGWNTVVKQAVLAFSVHFQSIVYANDQVIVKPCVTITAYKGGSDLTAFLPNRETASRLRTSNFNESIIPVLLSPGENVDRQFLDVNGKYNRNFVNIDPQFDSRSDHSLHYSTALMVSSFYGFDKERDDVSTNPYINPIMILSSRRNTICARGESISCSVSNSNLQWIVGTNRFKSCSPRAGLTYKGVSNVIAMGRLLKQSGFDQMVQKFLNYGHMNPLG